MELDLKTLQNPIVVKNVEHLLEKAIGYLPNILLALVYLVVGLFIINKVLNLFSTVMTKRKIDPSLSGFLSSLVNWSLKAILFISVATTVGVATSSLIAMLGAAGLAVGLAMQGSLSNFAGGVLILMFKPFKVGDYIFTLGEEGEVRKIDIFATTLVTFDNRRVYIPNGPLAGSNIVNVTAEKTRRITLPIGIAYSDRIDIASKALVSLCERNPKILKEPAPHVYVMNYGDSSIDLSLRAWVNTDDFWPVHFELNGALKETLDNAGISIPFPQRDVHLIKDQ